MVYGHCAGAVGLSGLVDRQDAAVILGVFVPQEDVRLRLFPERHGGYWQSEPGVPGSVSTSLNPTNASFLSTRYHLEWIKSWTLQLRRRLSAGFVPLHSAIVSPIDPISETLSYAV